MRPSPLRILTITIALTVGATGLAWVASASRRPEHQLAVLEPWIDVPTTIADASRTEVRTVLFRAYDRGEASPLVRVCGSYSNDETYVAHFADDAWSTRWRVRLTVHGQRVHALVEAELLPLPTGGGTPPSPPARAEWFDKSKLANLAEAWRTTALWAAPQDDPDCLDGIPTMLEACVAGRYAVRDRTCDGAAYEAAAHLRAAAHEVLPFPDFPNE